MPTARNLQEWATHLDALVHAEPHVGQLDSQDKAKHLFEIRRTILHIVRRLRILVAELGEIAVLLTMTTGVSVGELHEMAAELQARTTDSPLTPAAFSLHISAMGTVRQLRNILQHPFVDSAEAQRILNESSSIPDLMPPPQPWKLIGRGPPHSFTRMR